MARITGRNGALYADASAGASGSASKVAFMKHYTINGTRDKTDVTAFGDGTKVYIAGLADASGTADGFYDDESNDIYTIADGVARKFYKYVDDTDANTRKPISGSGTASAQRTSRMRFGRTSGNNVVRWRSQSASVARSPCRPSFQKRRKLMCVA